MKVRRLKAQRRNVVRAQVRARATVQTRVEWVGLSALVASIGVSLSAPGGAFAQAQVPGLPNPCPGAVGVCNGVRFDPLSTGSTLNYPNSNQLQINQNAASAIFNWQNFNIAAGNTVTFRQPDANAVALNRIYDFNRSNIEGVLRANGQIFLVNPNGILFGRTAVIDVGGLVASTLNISDDRITRGLLSDPNLANPVFHPDGVLQATPGSTTAGTITVQPGASIYAAGRRQDGTVVSAGRVFLFAPTVESGGDIRVDGGGQVILGAGSNVYLGSATDPTLRGLLVEVTGGVKVTNEGSIAVQRGNVTLIGLAVNQAGSITATSAIRENGSIRLIAREAAPTSAPGTSDPGMLFPAARTGQVTIASGSQTVVRLDENDAATAPLNDEFAAGARSSVEIQGGRIDIGGSASSGRTLLEARGGDVSITARVETADANFGLGSIDGQSELLGTEHREAVVSIGADTKIDVSGLRDVKVDGAQNFVLIDRITTSDLRDAPLQRDGFLKGQSAYVNVAEGSSILDLSARRAAVAGTQAERNAVGGTIALRAEGAVNVARGAVLDVSGGTVDTTAAVGRTSQLLTADGRIVDIMKASPDGLYVGFADRYTLTRVAPREGINSSVTVDAPSYRQVGGFSEGKAAGQIEIYAPRGAIEGTFVGTTTSSAQQRSNLPAGGSLRIGSSTAGPGPLDSQADLSRASILLADPAAIASAAGELDADRTIAIDTSMLQKGGFTRLDLTSDGKVIIASSGALDLGAGGRLAVQANAIDVRSSVRAAGGAISLKEREVSAFPGSGSVGENVARRDALNQVAAAERGAVRFAKGVTLDVAGNWTNDSLLPPGTQPTSARVLDGGAIEVSGRNVDVSGAAFDVSSGAAIGADGTFRGGAAGRLTFSASDQNLADPPVLTDAGRLTLGQRFAERLAGFGVTGGGSLTLRVPQALVIGRVEGENNGPAAPAVLDASIGQRGFSTLALSAFDRVTVAAGTTFAPQPRILQADPNARVVASTASVLDVLAPQALLPTQELPLTVSLAANNKFTGRVDVESGARIDAGVRGSIAINGGSAIAINGALVARGGSVALGLTQVSGTDVAEGSTLTDATLSRRVIDVGARASIDVSGASRVLADATERRSGAVLDGGSVSIQARTGSLVVRDGATIDASGTVDQVDVKTSIGLQRIDVASAGGNVALQATQGLFVDGRFNGAGGSAAADGGRLSVRLITEQGNSNALRADVLAQFDGTRTLTVAGAGTPSLPSQGEPLPSGSFADQGLVNARLVNKSGFDHVWLGATDRIVTGDSINLSTRGTLVLDTQTLVAQNGGRVSLSSSYVALGAAATVAADQRVARPGPGAATDGAATLTVDARQIDLTGHASLQGIGEATLTSTGDVRGVGAAARTGDGNGPREQGSLAFGGNLTISAAQVLPSTQTDFTFTTTAAPGAADRGRIEIRANAAAQAPQDPLSAGGSLTFTVNDLVASGRIVAPNGAIRVDAARSVTLKAGAVLSVHGDAIVPFGTVSNGETWTYLPLADDQAQSDPAFRVGSSAGTRLLEKRITVSAPSVDAQRGSTIDLRGGGDQRGTEFVAGPGGSFDVSLNFPNPGAPTQANTFFALIPARGTTYAPFDPQIFNDLNLNAAVPVSGQAVFRYGQTLTIGAGGPIPAGTYSVLPARYALLPGAYAVRPVSGYQDLAPSAGVAQADGTTVVAGRLGFADAGTAATRWTGYRIYSGAQFRQLAEFHDVSGNTFFADAAVAAHQAPPRQAQDAGALAIGADVMRLGGAIQSAPAANGRGADVSIAAPEIVVTDGAIADTAGPEARVTLATSTLNALGAESLTLGAMVARDGPTASLAHLGAQVLVQGTTPLQAGQATLAARNRVDVAAGAAVIARGSVADPVTRLVLGAENGSAEGAALYVGNADATPAIQRAGVASANPVRGTLQIGENTTLAGTSVVFDASLEQRYATSMQLDAGNVALSAARVNLGDAPAGTPGLVLDSALLARFGATRNLTVAAAGGFSAFGAVRLGEVDANGAPTLQSLTLDGPGLAAFGTAGTVVAITAGHVGFTNAGGAAPAQAGTGHATLDVRAIATATADGSVSVGGPINVSGVDRVDVHATGRVAGTQTEAHTGELRFVGAVGSEARLGAGAATIAIDSARITADRGVHAAIVTTGDIAMAATTPAQSEERSELGAQLLMQARSLDVGGRIDLPAGLIDLHAIGPAGTDGITLAAGSVLRAAGVSQTFASVTRDASAGAVNLRADHGSITQESGARIDIAGAGTRGDAGGVYALAADGAVTLGGALVSTAGSAARGAEIAIDAARLGDVSSLARTLETGAGGSQARRIELRARTGDIDVGAADTLRAQHIVLAADGLGGTGDGSVRIGGRLDASGTSGGRIEIYAGRQAALGEGAVVDAHATRAQGEGGQVIISARVTDVPVPATLDAVVVGAGARIDVSGGSAASGGEVTLRANRVGSDVAIASLPQTSIAGARKTIVEAVTVVTDPGDVTLGGVLQGAQGDLQTYMSAANRAAMTGRLGRTSDASFSLRPGLEVRAAGTITIGSAVDFATGLTDAASGAGTFLWRYGGDTLATSEPGALTLRAGGGVAINANLGDGFTLTAGSGGRGQPAPSISGTAWTTGDSWSYRIAAGADLRAAMPTQTGATTADLTIGNGDGVTNVVVRTGTGTIDLAAGRDIVLRNGFGQQGNVVYTAGVADVSAPVFATGQTPQLTQHGGDLRVRAGRDVVGTDGDANVLGSTQTINEWLFRGGRATDAAPTVWWTNFATFAQGFGALGGGNLAVEAARDIVRVGAVVPSNGFVVGSALSERNAGALTVTAGGDIRQGLFYDEAGTASLRARSIVPDPAAFDPQLVATRLALGSNTLDVQARESMWVTSPFNPTAYAAALANNTPGRANPYSSYFFTYGDDTRFDVRAAAGDAAMRLPLFNPSSAALPAASTFGGAVFQWADILPAQVRIVSFGGAVRLPADGTNGSGTFGTTGDIYAYRLFPRANGQLELLADKDIAYPKFALSQADPATLASAAAPRDFATQREPLLFSQPKQGATPLHAGDSARVEVVARGGSIIAPVLYLPKAAEIAAGEDIKGDPATFSGVGIKIQNVDENSFTSISAGGRIDLTQSNRVSLDIGGTGGAEVVAGSAIDLGTTGSGIVANGNINNNALAARGANLVVVAGAGRGADGFAQRPDYANVLRQFIRFDAFAATGSDAAALNRQALEALKKDGAYLDGSAYKQLVDVLQTALAQRGAIDDPASAVSQALAHASPAALANAAVKLGAAVQAVANKRFVASRNTDTFAPGYAVFRDLFPALSNDANAIRAFVRANPFVKSGDAEALRERALAGLPQSMADVIRLGLEAPASIDDTNSAFSHALAALDPHVLHTGARALLANTLTVAGAELDALRAANRIDAGVGSPFAQGLTTFASAFSPAAARGANDLSMVYSQIKAEQSGNVAIFTPQGGVRVGQASPPAGAVEKTPSDLGIFTLGGGDIIGMARDSFDVFRSRVFTVAGGDITLWSSQANIDAGRGPRDVAVAPAPRLVTDSNGITKLDIGGAVAGSGIGALRTRSDQAPSDIALIAPLGFIDAGEAGIRAETGSVTLGTNIVINAGNIQAASGVSGGAVVAAPPVPVPASTSNTAADRAAEEVTRAAAAQQQDAEERARKERRKRVTGEFLGFGRD